MASEDTVNRSGNRDASMLSHWLVDPKKHAILAACGSNCTPFPKAETTKSASCAAIWSTIPLLLVTSNRGGASSAVSNIYRRIRTT
ncbi:hypothetical protein BDW59DRAFT_151655 [Aspergillus cavernicola]|uniref:Uncharacterized protein n=1 Tax=Aspergillus cavernicola TaxID=176166 RepID=A0ABR4HUJ0_9EURO